MAEDMIVSVGADITGFLSKIDAAKAKVGHLTESQGQLKTVITDLNSSLRINEKELTTAAVNLQKLNTTTDAGKVAAANLRKEISQLAASSKTLSTDITTAKTSLAATTAELKAQNVVVKEAEKGSNAFTSGLSSVWGGLRKIAYILPGIGLAGLVNLIAGPVIEAFKLLFDHINNVSDAAKLLKANQSNLNEIFSEANKKAGEQTADLKVLYAAATNVNLSLKDRLAAVKGLQNEFPDFFANLKKEAILNGDAKIAYDDATLSIIARAKATAAQGKLSELEAQKMGIENERQKVLIATTNELNAAQAKLGGTTQVVGGLGVTAASQGLTKTQVQDIIKNRRDLRLATLDANDKSIADQEAFIQKYIGLPTLAKVIEDQNKPTGAAHAVETIADVLAKLSRQIAVINQEELTLHTDEAQKKISDIQSAISHLIDKFKLTATSPVIIELEADISAIKLKEHFKQVFKDLHNAPIPIPFDIQAGIEETKKRLADAYKTQFAPALQKEVVQAGLNINPFANSTDVTRMFKEAELAGHGAGKKFMAGLTGAKFDEFFTATEKLFNTEGQILTSTLVDAISGVGADIGKVLSGSIKGGQLFGDLFKIIGGALQQFGKALIEYGLGLKVLKLAFKSPATAIIAGIGLEVLGAIMEASIPKFASGGFVSGPGTSTSDSINARLSKGEYVVNAGSVNKYGKSFFDMINGGGFSRNNSFANGGSVSSGSIGGGFSQTIIPDVVIRGSDLVLVFDRQTARNSRNG